jgi:hypothetical protein
MKFNKNYKLKINHEKSTLSFTIGGYQECRNLETFGSFGIFYE